MAKIAPNKGCWGFPWWPMKIIDTSPFFLGWGKQFFCIISWGAEHPFTIYFWCLHSSPGWLGGAPRPEIPEIPEIRGPDLAWGSRPDCAFGAVPVFDVPAIFSPWIPVAKKKAKSGDANGPSSREVLMKSTGLPKNNRPQWASSCTRYHTLPIGLWKSKSSHWVPQEAPWQTVKLSEPPKPSLTSLRGHRNLSLSEPKVI